MVISDWSSDVCSSDLQALSFLPGNPFGRQTMRSGNILEWPFIIGDIVKNEPCFHRGMKGVRVQGRLWIIGPLFPMRQNDLNIIKRFHIEAADIMHHAFPTRIDRKRGGEGKRVTVGGGLGGGP